MNLFQPYKQFFIIFFIVSAPLIIFYYYFVAGANGNFIIDYLVPFLGLYSVFITYPAFALDAKIVNLFYPSSLYKSHTTISPFLPLMLVINLLIITIIIHKIVKIIRRIE